MPHPSEFRNAILNIETLSSTPGVLAKAARLVQDPHVSTHAICDLVRNDGPLTADIIRISNSILYKTGMAHTNLPSAVAAIGLREVLRAINLSLSRQMFARDLASYGITARDYFLTSIRTALFMEAIARNIGLNGQDAHMIGVLHAIGRVLINQILEDFRCSIYWDEKMPISKWEVESVGFNYAEAGAILLQKWQFAEEICHAIQHQLDPENETDQLSLLGVLQFSLRFLPQSGLGANRAAVDDKDPFLTRSHIAHGNAIQIQQEAEDSLEAIQTSLGIKSP